MSHYDEVLEEARGKASNTAKQYVPRLYHILVDEEHKTAEDARKIIEHDLLSYWAKTTVNKFLPQETKDEIKQEAGKKGAEKKKIMLLADGSRARMDSSRNPLEDPEITQPLEATIGDEYNTKEEPSPEELAEINQSLEIPQTQTIQNKTSDVQSLIENKILTEENIFEWLNKREDKMKYFYYGSCGTGYIKSNILANLENSGIKTFKRLYFEV